MQAIETFLTDWKTYFSVIDLAATFVSLIGIPWGLWIFYNSRRKIDIYILCKDGECEGQSKKIGSLQKMHAIRSEIVGLVTMKSGKGRMDLSDYQVDQNFKNNRVTVPLQNQDFQCWEGHNGK